MNFFDSVFYLHKECCLIGIVLNLLIAFGRAVIFTPFTLPIQEHWEGFHFFDVLLNLFRQRSEVVIEVFTLVRFISRLIEAIVNGSKCMVSF